MRTEEEVEHKEREEYIKGLRDYARFIELNPDFPLPYLGDAYIWAEDKEQVKRLISRRGKWDKQFTGENLIVEKTLGPVSIRIILSRDLVCERKVVGTKIVPAQEEKKVEIVEWKCIDPLLAPDKEEEPDPESIGEVELEDA